MTEQYTPTTEEVLGMLGSHLYEYGAECDMNLPGNSPDEIVDRWLAEVERAAAEKALARVRELHRRQPDTISGLDTGPAYCRCGEHYPCPTIRALEGDE